MVLVSGGITQPLLKMYTSAGVQLGVAVWDKGRIEAMGWTNEEELMIVEQTGEVTFIRMQYLHFSFLTRVILLNHQLRLPPRCACTNVGA